MFLVSFVANSNTKTTVGLVSAPIRVFVCVCTIPTIFKGRAPLLYYPNVSKPVRQHCLSTEKKRSVT
jgi:hypothetical protein